MSAQKTLVTADELLRISAEGKRCELVDGEVIEMAPTGVNHARVVTRIALALAIYVDSHDLGTVLTGDAGFVIRRNPDTVRAPDVAFLASERLARGSNRPGYFDGAPEIAVEVVSPSDYASEVQAKTQAWLEAGTRLVWVVFPESRTITVYRSQRDVTVLTRSDILDGKPVFSGFSAKVEEILR